MPWKSPYNNIVLSHSRDYLYGFHICNFQNANVHFSSIQCFKLSILALLKYLTTFFLSCPLDTVVFFYQVI